MCPGGKLWQRGKQPRSSGAELLLSQIAVGTRGGLSENVSCRLIYVFEHVDPFGSIVWGRRGLVGGSKYWRQALRIWIPIFFQNGYSLCFKLVVQDLSSQLSAWPGPSGHSTVTGSWERGSEDQKIKRIEDRIIKFGMGRSCTSYVLMPSKPTEKYSTIYNIISRGEMGQSQKHLS